MRFSPSGFQVLARRWVVERTIGWLTTNRRLAKDYERLVETGEMLLYLAMSRILLRRLTRNTKDNCSPASQSVIWSVRKYPVPALVTAVAAGYGLAWLIHGRIGKAQFRRGVE